MKKLLETIGTVAASFVEQNPNLLEYIRTHHFKGKVIVVSKLQEKFLPEDEFVADVKGIKYHLNIKDWIQKHIYFDTFERREIRTALRFVKRGGVYFDIGSNVGFYALNFAKQTGRNGKVFAFEPEPETYQKLVRNVELNQFQPIIETFNLAVSEKSGEKNFYISSESSSAWGTTIPEGKERAIATFSVKTISLDEFVNEKGIKEIDFMKVDIEGGEFELMEGATEVFKRKAVKKIFIECSGPSLSIRRKTLTEYLDMFKKVDYEPFGTYQDLIEKMKKGDAYQKMNVNLLFQPKP
jgi:FkbM family methyltransferase